MKTTFSLFFFLLAFLSTAWGDDEKPKVSVTGEAEVQVDPDLVSITLGVETRAREMSAAKNENDERIKRLISAVQGAGVPKTEIQTDYFQAEPDYEYSSSILTVRGYIVRNRVVVNLKQVSAFERVVATALDSGANHIHGISFQTSKLREYRDQARSLAIHAAKEKAAALAKELGQQLGNPLLIKEERNDIWSWYSGWWHANGAQRMTQNIVQNVSSGSDGSSETIAPGKLKITAVIATSFELWPGA